MFRVIVQMYEIFKFRYTKRNTHIYELWSRDLSTWSMSRENKYHVIQMVGRKILCVWILKNIECHSNEPISCIPDGPLYENIYRQCGTYGRVYGTCKRRRNHLKKKTTIFVEMTFWRLHYTLKMTKSPEICHFDVIQHFFLNWQK